MVRLSVNCVDVVDCVDGGTGRRSGDGYVACKNHVVYPLELSVSDYDYERDWNRKQLECEPIPLRPYV